MAAYTPTEFFKGSETRTVETWSEHYQALWEGWTPNGPAPERPLFSAEQLAEIDEQMKATYVAEADKGAPDGVAPLDAAGLLPAAHVPDLSDTYASSAAVAMADTLPLNVARYGTTDAAVRSALTDAVAQGRGLYFPPGTYNITGNLTVDANRLAITGEGDNTHLSFTDGGLVIDGASTAHSLNNRLGGFRVTRAGTAGPAVHLKGAGVGTGVARFGIYDVHVESSTGTAWRIDGSYIGVLTNCYGRGSTLGLDVNVDAATGVVGGNLLTFVGCEFQSNAKAAYLRTTAGVTFVGCGFEGNTAEGIELADNCRAVTFVNPYFEGNVGYDMKVGTVTSAIALVVRGGYFAEGDKGKTVAIQLIRGQAIDIGGVFFSGYGANSPIKVQEASAGAVRGEITSECWSNGTAPIVELNGAARFTRSKRMLRASQVLDFPAVGANASANLTMTVPGAEVGDDVTVHYNGTPPAGMMPLAWVSGADTVTIRLTNLSASTVDPPAATYRAIVWKS